MLPVANHNRFSTIELLFCHASAHTGRGQLLFYFNFFLKYI